MLMGQHDLPDDQLLTKAADNARRLLGHLCRPDIQIAPPPPEPRALAPAMASLARLIQELEPESPER